MFKYYPTSPESSVICQNYNSTTTRTFQIKFLNRILPTNSKLVKMNIINDNRCNFCKKEVETLTHLFWTCDITKIFWNKVFNWITTLLDTKIEFNATEVLFYCPISEPLLILFLLLQNNIFTIVKLRIFVQTYSILLIS